MGRLKNGNEPKQTKKQQHYFKRHLFVNQSRIVELSINTKSTRIKLETIDNFTTRDKQETILHMQYK